MKFITICNKNYTKIKKNLKFRLDVFRFFQKNLGFQAHFSPLRSTDTCKFSCVGSMLSDRNISYTHYFFSGKWSLLQFLLWCGKKNSRSWTVAPHHSTLNTVLQWWWWWWLIKSPPKCNIQFNRKSNDLRCSSSSSSSSSIHVPEVIIYCYVQTNTRNSLCTQF